MLRINLLPKEVIERRRYEGWYRWVVILGIGLTLIIVSVYLLLVFVVSSKTGELQSIQESSAQQRTLADQLSIFENQEQQFQARQKVAQTALSGVVNVGRVAADVSLVLPDEVWLDSLTIDEKTGMTFSAQTPRTASESDDVAYKSVAKTLVRLNELPELSDVWLNTAANGQWSSWAPNADSQVAAPLPVNVVTFQGTTKVSAPLAAGTGATVPPGTQ